MYVFNVLCCKYNSSISTAALLFMVLFAWLNDFLVAQEKYIDVKENRK